MTFLIILDGAEETALFPAMVQRGKMPALHSFAQHALIGQALFAHKSRPVDSLSCISTIFNLPAEELPASRAPLEALGAGVRLKPGSVVWRCNRAAVQNGRLASVPASKEEACRTFWQACRAFLPKRMHLVSLSGYRALLVQEAPSSPLKNQEQKPLSVCPTPKDLAQKTESVPSKTKEQPGQTPSSPEGLGASSTKPPARFSLGEEVAQAASTSSLSTCSMQEETPPMPALPPIPPPHQHLGEQVDTLLAPLKGETPLWHWVEQSRMVQAGFMVYPWDAGPVPFFERINKIPPLKATCICQAEIVAGLAKLCGMHLVQPKGITGDANTSLSAKLAAALVAAQKDALVVVHINGADELAHRQDTKGKAQFLQKVDRAFLAPLFAGLSGDARILITSDHVTSSQTGRHEREPVHWFGADYQARTGTFSPPTAQLVGTGCEQFRQLLYPKGRGLSWQNP